MDPEQAAWPFLRAKTTRRLAFMSSFSMPETPGIPCRLPECAELVSRSRKPGRTKWFHSQKCADAFRTRRRALDVATSELATAYLAQAHSQDVGKRMLSDFEWLMGVRQAYVAPDAWRSNDAGDRAPEAGSAQQELEDLLRRAREPADPCPTCRGSGDLAKLRAPLVAGGRRRRRAEVDLMAEMAGVFRRLSMLRPSYEGVQMLDWWEQRAKEGERHLQASLSDPSTKAGAKTRAKSSLPNAPHIR